MEQPAVKSGGLNRRMLLAVAVGFIVLLLASVVIALTRANNPVGSLLARAVVRQDNLLNLAKDSQPSIRNGDLLKVNSDAILFLTSDSASLRGLLTASGLSGLPASLVRAETDQTTAQKLQEAKSSGLFDTAYRQVLSQKIDAQQALLRELAAKTKNPALKQAIDAAYGNLSNLQNQLAGLKL